ncbi:class I SAM-dependent methyltransferase [Lentzea tibetensis]|uniref:Class I SAM-dependent methyltransferase n=1 Tax=Lentzea tibetensis TaxID=2591470 RepID=A0A563EIS9_9PSEU|nr:class I SAM-dependent methyltransferase [Lentzea tibetensis]TWP46736.1 class I SAM-dependent methyltransferase [Lentzea tibetensis]
MVGRRAYNFMYRTWAPWESGPREELVDLVTRHVLEPGRAIDLGCGSGANAIFLAQRGFEVTGVDFSPVGLEKARRKAKDLPARFLEGDLTADQIPGVDGTFDLLVDYGVLDDLRGPQREAMARTILRLSHENSRFLLWCFYDEIPWWRRKGARFPGLKPGEETELFGADWTIERLPRPANGFAAFLMSRRQR